MAQDVNVWAASLVAGNAEDFDRAFANGTPTERAALLAAKTTRDAGLVVQNPVGGLQFFKVAGPTAPRTYTFPDADTVMGGGSDANLSLSDITTGDVSSTRHGFAPKNPNNASFYLDGSGAYSVPPGSVTTQTTSAVGNQTGFNLTGYPCTFLRCTNATLLTFQGLTDQGGGHEVVLMAAGAGDVVINNDDAAATATKRVLTGTGGPLFLAAGTGWAFLVKDQTSNRWRVAGSSAREFPLGSGGVGSAASTIPLQKSITAILNATATTVLTVTIPNAAHAAALTITIVGSLGTGGAIGANEASAVATYNFVVTRTAGVNAVAAVSSVFGGAASAVAGAATVTATLAAAAVSGAVGAVNTIAIQVTITRSGGSSTNHTCQVIASVMNANASGITVA